MVRPGRLSVGLAGPLADEVEDDRGRDRYRAEDRGMPDLSAREAKVVACHAGEHDRDVGRDPQGSGGRQEIDILFHSFTRLFPGGIKAVFACARCEVVHSDPTHSMTREIQ